MNQQIFGRWTPGLYTNAYLPAFMQSYGTFGSNVEADVITRVPVAGTFRNLRVRLTQALVTGGHQFVFTLRKNGADTAMTVTITVATGVANVTDSSNAVTFAAGDTITMKANGGGVAPTRTAIFSLEFEADADDTSIHSFGGVDDALSTTTTRYDSAFDGGGGWESHTQIDIVAVAGTLTTLNYSLSTAPGSGKSRTFTIMKNGVAQDGSGGTVDTRLTISDAATTGTSTFSLPLAVADRLAVRSVPTSSPAASNGCGAVAFVSNSSNTWNVCGHAGVIRNAAVTFSRPVGDMHTTIWDATESVLQHDSGLTAFSLSGLRVAFATAPGSGNSWQLTLRKNNADTAQTVTLSDTTTVAYAGPANEIALESGDVFSLESTPTSSPAGPDLISWSYVGSTDPATIICATVFGQHGTVTSSNTFLANLDETTRTVHAENCFYVAGYFVLHEQAGAPTPIANTAILYTKDTGGKTELLVQFPTGSAIQIAIEA
jgi:hypothetical protein